MLNKDVWRFATMKYGAQFVILTLMLQMPPWSANSLVSQVEVLSSSICL